MRAGGVTALILIIIFLGASTAYLLYDRFQNPQTAEQQEAVGGSQPTPARDISPSPSPTPAGQIQVAGEVTDIIGPVGYKNSTLIEINDEQRVYITGTTRITDQNNNTVNRSEIRLDATVVVSGIPAEGGLEANTVTLISPAASPLPTSQPTGQPTLQQQSPTP